MFFYFLFSLFPKVQLKYQPKGRPKSTSSEDDGPKVLYDWVNDTS